MSEVIASGKYGVLVMANLEGAFDAICRNGANYKLHKAGLRNKWVLVFLSFLNDRHSRNLVTSWLVFNWKRCTARFYFKSLYLSGVYCQPNYKGYYPKQL